MSSLDLLSRQLPAFVRRGERQTAGRRATATQVTRSPAAGRHRPRKGDLRLGILAALLCWALLLSPLLFVL